MSIRGRLDKKTVHDKVISRGRPLKGVDKRKAQRLVILLRVEYKLKGSKSWIKAECVNISGAGIRFLTANALRLGDFVQVRIYVKEADTRPLACLARVCWVRENMSKNQPKRFDAGLEFTQVRDMDRFTEFLCGTMVDGFYSDAR